MNREVTELDEYNHVETVKGITFKVLFFIWPFRLNSLFN